MGGILEVAPGNGKTVTGQTCGPHRAGYLTGHDQARLTGDKILPVI